MDVLRECSVGKKILVTNFLYPMETPKRMLKVPCKRRWNLELDLRRSATSRAYGAAGCSWSFGLPIWRTTVVGWRNWRRTRIRLPYHGVT